VWGIALVLSLTVAMVGASAYTVDILELLIARGVAAQLHDIRESLHALRQTVDSIEALVDDDLDDDDDDDLE